MSELVTRGSATKKISGGKLIRVDVVYADQVEQVKITGDFFLHPEELITVIEENLTGTEIPLSKDLLVGRIQSIINNNDATVIGFSPEDLISVLMDAVK